MGALAGRHGELARENAQQLTTHRARVEPVRMRDLASSLRLETVALRVVGYHFVCSCGACGMLRTRYATAQAEALWHTG